MKIIDISWPLDTNTTIVPGELPISFEATKTFSNDAVREHIIHMNAHAGTHIDAPSYLFRDGKTIDQIDLSTCVGAAHVIDLTDIDVSIKKEHLEHQDIRNGDIILLKTKNSNLSPTAAYNPSFVYLDHSGAEYLVQQKVKAIGFDYIIMESEKEFDRAHRILLHNEITVVEGLRLCDIASGVYFFFCLPLYAIGIEAAPARAILLDVSEDIAEESGND